MSKKKEPFNFAKLYRRTGLIVYDVMSIILASYIAVIMRYEFKVDAIPDYFLSPVNKFLPINILLTIVVYYIFKL